VKNLTLEQVIYSVSLSLWAKFYFKFAPHSSVISTL